MTCPSWSGMSRKPGAPLSTFTETLNVSPTSFSHTPFELFALNQGCVLPKSWWKGSWPLFAVHRYWIMNSLSCVLGCGLLVDNRYHIIDHILISYQNILYIDIPMYCIMPYTWFVWHKLTSQATNREHNYRHKPLMIQVRMFFWLEGRMWFKPGIWR